MGAKDKKNGMFSKIESREDALKTIRDCAVGFFCVAALQACLGYFIIAPNLIVDAVLYTVLAGIMLKWNSRVAAMFLLVIACLSMYATTLNRLGMAADAGNNIMAPGRGNNIILASIILWVAIRSVEATFRVNGKYAKADI